MKKRYRIHARKITVYEIRDVDGRVIKTYRDRARATAYAEGRSSAFSSLNPTTGTNSHDNRRPRKQ